MDALLSLQNNFKYVSGETPMSRPYEVVGALVFYVVTFFTLSKLYGYLSRGSEASAEKIAKAKAQRAFYKPFLIAHNLILSIGSAVMLGGLLTAYVTQFQQQNASFSSAFVRTVCDPGQELFGKMQFWLYVFYLSKIYEFLDTFFLCLTMRPVIPLHYIHHVLTLCVAWIGLETKHTVMGVACVMNTLIHVIMYAYYAYKLVDPDYVPWWKKSLTKLQMRQFMVNVVGLAVWTYMDQFAGMDCTGELWVIYVVLFTMVVFLGMFAAFAKKAYNNKKQ